MIPFMFSSSKFIQALKFGYLRVYVSDLVPELFILRRSFTVNIVAPRL
jgi:hypothetical protein